VAKLGIIPLNYASKGEYRNAAIAGVCGIINAYYAGYQSKNLSP